MFGLRAIVDIHDMSVEIMHNSKEDFYCKPKWKKTLDTIVLSTTWDPLGFAINEF